MIEIDLPAVRAEWDAIENGDALGRNRGRAFFAFAHVPSLLAALESKDAEIARLKAEAEIRTCDGYSPNITCDRHTLWARLAAKDAALAKAEAHIEQLPCEGVPVPCDELAPAPTTGEVALCSRCSALAAVRAAQGEEQGR